MSDPRTLDECRKRQQWLYAEIEYAKYDLGPNGPSWRDAADKQRIETNLIKYQAELKSLIWTIFIKATTPA
jgi:hypothetical protein